MKNKIAIKLTLCFTGVLLVFALIISGVFYQFFRQHTVELEASGDGSAGSEDCRGHQRQHELS